MALNTEQILQLAKMVASADYTKNTKFSVGGESFSYQQISETLRDEFRALAPNYRTYEINKNTIFALIEQTIDDVLPKKVLETYGQFAEIKQFSQGDKPVFIQKITEASRRRAKQFITKVGLAGTYETFELAGKSFEVTTSAYGGAASIGFEEFLDGRIDFADLLDVLYEGIDEQIYKEIQKALMGTVSDMPVANKTTQTGFVEAEMDKILARIDSYGPATIYATFEFAATMIPEQGWVSDAMKDKRWNNGYLGDYKGHKVIVLPQSYTDETNEVKVIDPSHAWIFPTGASKPVKIAFEGDAIVSEYENRDLSREIQIYKKVGVGTLVQNNIGVYVNTSLKIKD